MFLAQNAVDAVFPRVSSPLLLITVLFYALSGGAFFGFLAGGWAGFLLELFGLGPLGGQMILLGAAGTLGGLLSRKLFRDSLWTQTLVAPVFFYLVTLSNLWLMRATVRNEPAGFSLLGEAFLPFELLVTAIMAPLIFRFLKLFS